MCEIHNDNLMLIYNLQFSNMILFYTSKSYTKSINQIFYK